MKKYILTIDAGTTGLTVILFDDKLKVIDKEYYELSQIYPKENWVEHNPIELIDKIELATEKITKKHLKKNITSIGITNQRESVVVWNKKTGKPIYNTIVWQCKRTNDFCKSLKKEKKSVFKKTGLYIDSYFSKTRPYTSYAYNLYINLNTYNEKRTNNYIQIYEMYNKNNSNYSSP